MTRIIIADVLASLDAPPPAQPSAATVLTKVCMFSITADIGEPISYIDKLVPLYTCCT